MNDCKISIELEKMLFLEMCKMQFLTRDRTEYMGAYFKLDDIEHREFCTLRQEIYACWKYLNTYSVSKSVYDIETYNASVVQIDPRILQVASEFGLTLKLDR